MKASSILRSLAIAAAAIAGAMLFACTSSPKNNCTPTCGSKVCGSNGCGGSCGTCASGKSCSASGQCVGAPAAPTGLTATAGDTLVALSWAAPADDGGTAITGYNVYRGSASGALSTKTKIATGLTGTNFVDAALTDGTAYYYQVTAVSSAGESVGSAEATGTPATGATVPCGSVDQAGYCAGDSAVWCNADPTTGDQSLAAVSCGALGTDANGNTISGHCADLGSFGAWCAVAEGTTCSDGQSVLACGSASGADLSLACDVNTGCTKTTQTCTAPAAGAQFTPVCDGDELIGSCTPWNQILEENCKATSVGGTGCQNGACVGIPEGGNCDGQLFKCADPDVCDTNNTGTCVKPCGNVTAAGDCSTDTHEWCDTSSGALQTEDCTTVGQDANGNTVAGKCGTVGSAAACVLPQGAMCASFTGYYACGSGSTVDLTMACDMDTGCRASGGTATCTYAGDGNTFTPACSGNDLVEDCTAWNQPVVEDCTGDAVGGTGCASGACTGIAAGKYCDGQEFKCADGLTCDSSSGTCKAASGG